ncbi:EAL domain-containing protein (putative c-di-GMP-specific phosphodiesterase class I) [Vreelandella songnenensis]|uniref:EAL domain-containing protein (Putative c-di-GMP-specific phosphodiesterase class I) n=1 Tax=Vreelandella songnenensis TaxID=1176243 RepID=A0A2T0V6Q1_9GAMM|nr:EAL domain-containing protein [Halomonas songnenensis]PRY65824.1 EAL domain-containing protein (putative c-di-GMP-specific phosphodiesterase class I) [Halomonas songnenensis]
MSTQEQDRLFALRQLNLLDTSPSESFDRITRMASQLFDLPIAAVSLTDENRQWFKSRVGVDHWEIPRETAPCADVCDSSKLLVIPDLLASKNYRNSHLANSGIRFYAGAPLITREGHTLGAMCVLGTQPREVSEQEQATLQDLATMVMAQIELQHAFGRIDPLTGLSNRHQFAEDLQDMQRDAPNGQRVALFTQVVDASELGTLHRTVGPAFLDDLARITARCLQQAIGSKSKLYHLGGCQFVHLVEHKSDADLLEEATRLRLALLALESAQAIPVLVRPTMGIAPFRLSDVTAEDVLRTAHAACLDAHQAGKAAGLFSLDLDAHYQRRFSLLGDIGPALESADELYLLFQPRVSLATGECLGAEALLRWQHPTLGEVSPNEFIPLIENTPMVKPLTQWVLHHVVQQAAAWHRAGKTLQISVNVSATNLEEEDFALRLLDLMARMGLPSTAIEVELTESAMISQGEVATTQLKALIAAGLRVAIDDFGTGYSSLAYLHEIPAHTVKIDRSFITELGEDARTETLVNSMISMAHDLGYRVVAEGIENDTSYRRLMELGCDEAQGYFIAKPLLPTAFETWLQNRAI